MRLVALIQAFYKGDRIRAGEEFDFDGKELPKWAAPAGTPLPKPKDLGGDTKPAAAKKAAERKKASGTDLA